MGKRRCFLDAFGGEEDPDQLVQRMRVDGAGGSRAQAEAPEPAKSVGRPILDVGKGKTRWRQFKAFEYDGDVYELGDTVLITPEEPTQKPYVAIIKDIAQEANSLLIVTGQWFYRPEEAVKRDGGIWPGHTERELFYSFHLDLVPAESVMHKCVVHFVPLQKQLPLKSKHPGFIVQKVYDFVEKNLWGLADKEYEVSKQQEIDFLVQKTQKQLGELPDINPKLMSDHKKDRFRSKWNDKGKNILSIDIPKDILTTNTDQPGKTEIPKSCTSDVKEHHAVLTKFGALTNDKSRNRWLMQLLQGFQQACSSIEDTATQDTHKGNVLLSQRTIKNNSASFFIGTKHIDPDVCKSYWPDTAIPIITAIERFTFEALDSQKYNQKMRQLEFNLKNNNGLLVRRLLNRELEPVALLAMSPDELKNGFTAEETTTEEPEKLLKMQMTDARCSRCMEKKVGIADIINAGACRHRYQLECIACGNTWYTSQNAIMSLAADVLPITTGDTGTAP